MDLLEGIVGSLDLPEADRTRHVQRLTGAFGFETDELPHAAYLLVRDVALGRNPSAGVERAIAYLELERDDPIVTGFTTRSIRALEGWIHVPRRLHEAWAARSDLHTSGSSALSLPGLSDDLTRLALENEHSTLDAHPGNPRAWDARSVHLGASEPSDSVSLMRPIYPTAGVCSYAEARWRYALDKPDARIIAIDLPEVPAAAAIKTRQSPDGTTQHSLVALADVEGRYGRLAAGGLYTTDIRTLRTALDAAESGARRVAIERLCVYPARFLDEARGAGAVRRVRERLFGVRERANAWERAA